MEMDWESDTENDIVELQAALLPTSTTLDDIPVNQEHAEHNQNNPTNQADISDRLHYIHTALKLNNMLDDALAQVKSNLVSLLTECRNKLQNVQTSIKSSKTEQEKKKQKSIAFGYKYCGIPFFKDLQLFPAPPNPDAIKMNNLRILNYVNLPHTIAWTAKNKKILEAGILDIARARKINDIKYDIKKMDIQLHKNSKIVTEEILEKQNYLSDYLMKINSLPLSDLVKPLTDKEEYDWEMIADIPGINHSANECRSMWTNFLHPSINKASWSHSEQMTLKNLIRKHSRQDWVTIAAELKTNRSAYQCFIFYKMHIGLGQISKFKWTPEEDEFLLNVVDSCRIGNYISWTKVSFYIENRTKDQIYHRYKYSLEGSRRVGRFSLEEDTVLLAAWKQYGNDFNRIAKFLPTRSALQIRVRFKILKSPAACEWTLEEDKKLFSIISQPGFKNKDSNYSEISKKFEGKSRGSVRNRCIKLKKWIKANPKQELALIPRRKIASRDNSKIPDVDLETAIKLLQESLRVDLFSMKILNRPELNESRKGIDNKFLSYFKDTVVNTKPIISLASSSSNIDIKSILTLLHARLNKNMAQSELSRSTNQRSNQVIKSLICYEQLPIAPIKTPIVRTYSRKKNIVPLINSSNESTTSSLNIWSEGPIPQSTKINHVFPPCYSTVTTFRELILQAKKINSILPREPNSHTLLWKARFEAIFLWPAHLAALAPNFTHDLFENDETMDET